MRLSKRLTSAASQSCAWGQPGTAALISSRLSMAPRLGGEAAGRACPSKGWACAHLQAVGGSKNVHSLLLCGARHLQQQLGEQPARHPVVVAAPALAEAVHLVLCGWCAQWQHSAGAWLAIIMRITEQDAHRTHACSTVVLLCWMGRGSQ